MNTPSLNNDILLNKLNNELNSLELKRAECLRMETEKAGIYPKSLIEIINSLGVKHYELIQAYKEIIDFYINIKTGGNKN